MIGCLWCVQMDQGSPLQFSDASQGILGRSKELCPPHTPHWVLKDSTLFFILKTNISMFRSVSLFSVLNFSSFMKNWPWPCHLIAFLTSQQFPSCSSVQQKETSFKPLATQALLEQRSCSSVPFFLAPRTSLTRPRFLWLHISQGANCPAASDWRKEKCHPDIISDLLL